MILFSNSSHFIINWHFNFHLDAKHICQYPSGCSVNVKIILSLRTLRNSLSPPRSIGASSYWPIDIPYIIPCCFITTLSFTHTLIPCRNLYECLVIAAGMADMVETEQLILVTDNLTSMESDLLEIHNSPSFNGHLWDGKYNKYKRYKILSYQNLNQIKLQTWLSKTKPKWMNHSWLKHLNEIGPGKSSRQLGKLSVSDRM